MTDELTDEARAKATRDALNDAGMNGELFMRLSGFYRVGPAGRSEPEFGYRDFRSSDLRQPIQSEAAAVISELLALRRATPADDLQSRPALMQIAFLAAEARPAGYVMALERIEKIARAALAQKGDA